MFFFDPTMIILIPAILVTIWAQAKVSSTYNKFSKYGTRQGLTAMQVARNILDSNGLQDIRIERVRGNLTDHYDPKGKVLRLSDSVINSCSIAAIGVAAHECGHAVQDSTDYFPLRLRSAVVPVANFGSTASWILLLVGLIIGNFDIAMFGVVLFGVVVFFQLVTLPVEFNASSRALATLETGGYMTTDEIGGAKKVLSAAALTYVAAMLMAVMQLLRFALLALGANRDE